MISANEAFFTIPMYSVRILKSYTYDRGHRGDTGNKQLDRDGSLVWDEMGDIGDRGRGGVISSSSPLSLSPPSYGCHTCGRTDEHVKIELEFWKNSQYFYWPWSKFQLHCTGATSVPFVKSSFCFFPWHWALTSWSLENTPIERPKILVTYDTHIETFLTIIGRLVVINRFYPKCVCRDFHHLRENSKLSFLRQKMQWQRTGSHPLSLASLAVTHLRQQKSSQI